MGLGLSYLRSIEPRMLFIRSAITGKSRQRLPVSRCREMRVQVPQEIRRVAVGKIVVCPDQKRAGVADLFRLGKISIFLCVHIIEQAGELPVISCVCRALHPAHEGKGQKRSFHEPMSSRLPVRTLMVSISPNASLVCA